MDVLVALIEVKSDERVSKIDNSAEVKPGRLDPEFSVMTVIQPYPASGDGYSWSESTVWIAAGGNYTLAVNLPETIVTGVRSSGVTT